MRVLVVGAGAVGGYFGARLAEKGVDVTFLVRKKRQEKLKETGLIVQSIHGDIKLDPKTILASDPKETFDIVLISTKAYHFIDALEDIKPFVSSETVIIPMLNGFRHLDELKNKFAPEQIMGGLCFIESTLDQEGRIIQTSETHGFIFGEFSGEDTPRVLEIEKLFSGTKATIRKSNKINTDIWNKYIHISCFSGITTLFRSNIGPILEAENGTEIIEKLLVEIVTIARAVDAPIEDNIVQKQLKSVQEQDYTMKSSMLRDMEKKQMVEADHIHGYLIELARENGIPTPYLDMVYANLRTYEIQMKFV